MLKGFEKEVLRTRIILARKRVGMTQAQLAKKAGITPAALSQIEKGSRIPSIPVLHRLAKVLELSLDYLAGNTDKSELEDLLQDEDIRTFYRGLESLDPDDKQAVIKYVEFLHSKYEEIEKNDT